MKYAALTMNAVALLLLGWVAWGLVQWVLPGPARGPVLRAPPMELTPLAGPLRAEQERLADVVDMLQRLPLQAGARAGATRPLIATPAPGSQVADSLQMPRRSLSLHLDDLAMQTQAVVVDEQLARQGSRLGEGGRVAAIKPQQVIVSERLGLQTLTLPEDSLRVGTLRWPDNSLASVNTSDFLKQATP